jgi:RNA polymerase sigma-70 factor (ECF subfamily)
MAPPDDGTGGAFGAERPRLLGLAYRMLGSPADAEDVVQDAWIRWAAADRSALDNPAAWLTTVTTRLALDRLRTLSRRRESYVGPWLPEPVVPAAADDPAAGAELAESLTLGFLVVLDTLSAVERSVFLLAEVFGEPYAVVSAAVGRPESSCRQIATRARRKVRAARPPQVSSAPPRVLAELLAAVARDDADAVMALLGPDVVVVSDGGAARRTARRPVAGPSRVARYLVNLARRFAGAPVELLTANGEAVVALHLPDGLTLLGADVVGDRVVAIRVHGNPDKLTRLDHPLSLG